VAVETGRQICDFSLEPLRGIDIGLEGARWLPERKLRLNSAPRFAAMWKTFLTALILQAILDIL
jgi:hypothetical protein